MNLATKNVLNKIEKATAIVYSKDENCLGTAWFVDMNDLEEYLVTCYHVVAKSDGLKISFSKKVDEHQARFPAETIFVDKENDLALLKLKNPEDVNKVNAFEHLQIGDKSSLVSGETVYNVSHPMGWTFISGQGIISNVEYGDCGFLPTSGYSRFFVELKSANYGCSGSAVCAKNGKVVGVVSQGGGITSLVEGHCACISCIALENFMSKAKQSLDSDVKKEKPLGKTYKKIREEYTSTAWAFLAFWLIGQIVQYQFYFTNSTVFATQWFFDLFMATQNEIMGCLIASTILQAVFVYCLSIFAKKMLIKRKKVKLLRIIYFIFSVCLLFLPLLSSIL